MSLCKKGIERAPRRTSMLLPQCVRHNERAQHALFGRLALRTAPWEETHGSFRLASFCTSLSRWYPSLHCRCVDVQAALNYGEKLKQKQHDAAVILDATSNHIYLVVWMLSEFGIYPAMRMLSFRFRSCGVIGFSMFVTFFPRVSKTFGLGAHSCHWFSLCLLRLC